MKRTLYETELFYSKEAALGPHIEEKGTKGLKKWLCLMFLEHPHPQNKKALQANTNMAYIPEKDQQTGCGQHCFLETICRSLEQPKFYRVTKYCNCSFRFLYSPL